MILEDPDNDWIVVHDEDEHGGVIRLCFAHRKILDLARLYPEAQLIDATYKTKRYNKPVIHFVSVISVARRHTNKSGSNLSTAFCFVTSENDEDYTWATNA